MSRFTWMSEYPVVFTMNCFTMERSFLRSLLYLKQMSVCSTQAYFSLREAPANSNIPAPFVNASISPIPTGCLLSMVRVIVILSPLPIDPLFPSPFGYQDRWKARVISVSCCVGRDCGWKEGGLFVMIGKKK